MCLIVPVTYVSITTWQPSLYVFLCLTSSCCRRNLARAIVVEAAWGLGRVCWGEGRRRQGDGGETGGRGRMTWSGRLHGGHARGLGSTRGFMHSWYFWFGVTLAARSGEGCLASRQWDRGPDALSPVCWDSPGKPGSFREWELGGRSCLSYKEVAPPLATDVGSQATAIYVRPCVASHESKQ